MPLPCKPDSVPPFARLDGHFSHPAEAERPACAECDYYPEINGRAALPLFCLAPREVCHAVRLPGFAVGSYSTISPLPVALRPIGGIFLLHCLSGFLSSPVPHFHEARCPVVSGLSSTPPCGEIATVRGAAGAPWGSPGHFPIKNTSRKNHRIIAAPMTILNPNPATVPTTEPTPEIAA